MAELTRQDKVGSASARAIRKDDPELHVAAPRPGTGLAVVGPVHWTLMSGDAWDHTPSFHNAGLWVDEDGTPYTDGDVATGLGSAFFPTENELYAQTWGEQTVGWPVFTGGGESVTMYPSNNPNAVVQAIDDPRSPWAVTMLGQYETPGYLDNGCAFVALAAMTDDWLQVSVEPFNGNIYRDEFTDFFHDDWWSTPPSDYEHVAYRAVAASVPSDRVIVLPIPGTAMPAGCLVWSEAGHLYAARFEITTQTWEGQVLPLPSLKTTLGAVVDLGEELRATTRHLELAWSKHPDGAVLAWASPDGIRTAVLDTTGDTPVLGAATVVLDNTYDTVDVSQVNASAWVVVGGKSSTGAYRVFDPADPGTVIASGSVSGQSVRGSAVAGKVALLSRGATRWTVTIHGLDGSSSSFDAGPITNYAANQQSTRAAALFVINPAINSHQGAILGNPDGRLCVYIRNRMEWYDQPYYTNVGFGEYPELLRFGPLNLYLYDADADTLSLRDAVELMGQDRWFVSSGVYQEACGPLRLHSCFDSLIMFDCTGGVPGASYEEGFTTILYWTNGFTPDYWFNYGQPAGDNRFVFATGTTNWFGFGPHKIIDGELTAGDDQNSLVLFELDENGNVSKASPHTRVNSVISDFTAVGASATHLWGCYSHQQDWGNYDPTSDVRLATWNIVDNGDSFTLDPVNDVIIQADDDVISNVGAYPPILYMGDNILVMQTWDESFRVLQVNDDGTVAGHVITPFEGDFIGIRGPTANSTGVASLWRIGDSDSIVVPLTSASSAFVGSGSQLGFCMYRLNRATLAMELQTSTRFYDSANPTVEADFLGRMRSGDSPAWHTPSSDGRVVAVQMNLEPATPPSSNEYQFMLNVPTSQPWAALDYASNDIIAFVTFNEAGTIDVSYAQVEQPWTSREGQDSYHVIRDTDALTWTMAVDDRTAITISLAHDDMVGYPTTFVTNWARFYAATIVRSGETAQVTDLTPLHVSDYAWHTGLIHAPGHNYSVFYYDYFPLPKTRNETYNTYDNSSFSPAFRTIRPGEGPRDSALILDRATEVHTIK